MVSKSSGFSLHVLNWSSLPHYPRLCLVQTNIIFGFPKGFPSLTFNQVFTWMPELPFFCANLILPPSNLKSSLAASSIQDQVQTQPDIKKSPPFRPYVPFQPPLLLILISPSLQQTWNLLLSPNDTTIASCFLCLAYPSSLDLTFHSHPPYPLRSHLLLSPPPGDWINCLPLSSPNWSWLAITFVCKGWFSYRTGNCLLLVYP